MPTRKPTVRQDAIVQAFAERLKALRAARDMTQRELATKAHVTFSYISRLEAGGAAPGLDLLQKLAQALDANIADLLPGPEAGEVGREDVKKLFDTLLPKAGPETLSMLAMFLTRLAESPTTRR